MKSLNNITELRGLIELIGYFQKYIPHYAQLIKPLFQILLTKGMSSRENKRMRIELDEEKEQAKYAVLNIIADAFLQIPLEGNNFVIETDTLDKEIGAILYVERENELIPVEFFSKKFVKSAANWLVREKEAYAIVMVLKKFDRYIGGREIKIYTDDESLKWFESAEKIKVYR